MFIPYQTIKYVLQPTSTLISSTTQLLESVRKLGQALNLQGLGCLLQQTIEVGDCLATRKVLCGQQGNKS